ncbi:MAG: Hint domain-containing protein, partial [Acidobacteriota bacterium]|nr:Hint domain-containing protein [Acidobacteriota bacterium]
MAAPKHTCGPSCQHVRVDAPASWDDLMIAQAIVGPHMLVKAESSPIADVWYRDRPMRELSERLIDRYREMLARMIDAVRLYIEQHIVSGRLGKSARPALVTPEQLDAIRRIIGDHHAAFVAGGIEPSAISPYELQRLRASGLVTGDLVYVFGTGTAAPMRVIEDAFQYGRDLGSVSHPKEKRPIEARSYQEWRDRTAQPPMTEAERSTVSWASTKAAQEIRGLGNRVSDNFATIAIEADQEQRRQYENVIREELSANVEAREGWRKVVTALGDRTDDWARDLGRIAATEKHGALQEGQAAAMKRKSGRKSGDVRVAKQPNPDACKNCLRLFMEGGTPRIFWLSELEANGTNVGRKVAEWLPTVGPVHPWCFPAGTSIETEAGPLAIEVVETGTLVRTHLGRLRAVQRLSQRIHRGDLVVITAGDDLLEATPEHPLLTQRGWVRASAVEIGDQLFRPPHLATTAQEPVAHDVHYHAVPVTSATRRPFDGVVYNFSVEEDESYVAGGFAVHNCACELVEVPEGWAFDESGDLVPEILKRSALLESSLQKSAASLKQPMLFGGAGGDGGVTVRIGDPLLRAAVEAVIARTPSEIFTRATGVTLITTDHPRLTNALD